MSNRIRQKVGADGLTVKEALIDWFCECQGCSSTSYCPSQMWDVCPWVRLQRCFVVARNLWLQRRFHQGGSKPRLVFKLCLVSGGERLSMVKRFCGISAASHIKLRNHQLRLVTGPDPPTLALY